ncbi:MAG: hypothetical protein J0L92_29390 [Deltaproteobacteria bacterium]|nr:hypothetical protein [Deltaproteobacteria bacterium]
MKRARAIVGVSDHAGYALFVTATREGVLIDRRRVALLDDGVPVMPHHHDGQRLPIEEAVALVARVRANAERTAHARLEELARSLDTIELEGIALRADPALPPTVAERIADYRAMCVADWVMYRTALGDAARARGWSVHRYEPKRVLDAAARALGRSSIDGLLLDAGRAVGPPWTKEHRLAMAAAIAVSASVVGTSKRAAREPSRRRAGT